MFVECCVVGGGVVGFECCVDGVDDLYVVVFIEIVEVVVFICLVVFECC